jgi:MoxR-like ATPase
MQDFIPLDKAGKTEPLPEFGPWPATQHLFSADDLRAVTMAYMAGRPLLLRGEPGCGKSQLARAVAQTLGWPLLSKVINARCEPEDLLYRLDAVARLAKAQILPRDSDAGEALAPENFLLPEILWWALSPFNAQKRFDAAKEHCGSGCDYGANAAVPFDSEKGCVVLLDEMDKADAEVPNSLLEVFSLGGFSLPYGGGCVTVEGVKRPLLIITTNEERELPAAFVRRCLVHQMNPPRDGLEAFFRERVRAHYTSDEVSDAVLDESIGILIRDRSKMKALDLPLPGLAELLDLLRAIVEMGKGTDVDEMKGLSRFAFEKYLVD